MAKHSEKLKWPFPPVGQPNRLWKLSSRIHIIIGGTVSRVLAQLFNTTKVHNKGALERAIDRRPGGVPLITCSNHTSCIDDPFLFGVIKYRYHFNPKTVRWSFAANDICFTKDWHCRFFGLAKTVPVIRGGGVYQRGMDFVLGRLNMGEWLHIFPEGKVNMTSDFLRLKWGIGRLISECDVTPVVIPIWHLGLTAVLPNHPPYIPRVGKKVTICVGEPLDFRDTLAQLRESGLSPKDIRKAVTDIVQAELQELKDRTKKLHY